MIETQARLWTRFLDQEEFDKLPPLMTSDCEYLSPSGTITGPDAIIDSYRKNAVWAHATFEHIEWSSELELLDARRVRITFEDRTLHQGISHRYRCRQYLQFDESNRIEGIRHEAIPEEEDALAAFFRKIGVER